MTGIGGGGVLGAVLAGGASSRFGSDKAVARVGGRTLIDLAAAALSPFVAAVVVVGRTGGEPDRPLPRLGPLGGIAGALTCARRDGFVGAMTIGCDMPWVPADLLASLRATAPSYCPDAPVLGHWPVAALDPLLAWLEAAASRVAPAVASGATTIVKDRSLSVRRWAASLGASAIAAPGPIRNVNTPADLSAP